MAAESISLRKLAEACVDDTQLLAYCMNLREIDLKGLALQELGLEMRALKDVVGKSGALADAEVERMVVYCGAVGDGPAKNATRNGKIFVGHAGKTLDLLLASIGLRRDGCPVVAPSGPL